MQRWMSVRGQVARCLWMISVFWGLQQSSTLYGESQTLSCEDVQKLTAQFTQRHLLHRSFDDELAQRVLKRFIEHWDGRKHYFLKADIHGFMEEYGSSLDDRILDGDCSPIAKIVDLYGLRFTQRISEIEKLIGTKHDFSREETLYLDPDHYDYSSDARQLSERWRKWIKYQHMQLMKGLSHSEVRKKLVKRYELRKKRFDEITLSDVYTDFIKSFAMSLDPHSSYYSAQDYENFKIAMSLSLEGIGVTISSEDGFTKIQRVLPGGPAYRHGVLDAGDKILSVAQEDGEWVNVVDRDLDDVVTLIRGPRQSLVKLLVLREGITGVEKFEVLIERDEISVEEEAVQAYHYLIDDVLQNRRYKIGVAQIPSFYADLDAKSRGDRNYRRVSEDLRRALKQLTAEGIDALVVDVRNNGGGTLDEGIELSDLFLPRAPVVQIQGKKGSDKKIHRSQNNRVVYAGPLVVLMNIASASASEIFVGAIKDHRRGVLVGVGERTYGKGTVQELVPAAQEGVRSMLRITVTRFYTPEGRSTQLKGVGADLSLPSWSAEREYGERYREYAVPWHKISSASLKDLGAVTGPILKRLTSFHEQRRVRDEDFYMVRQFTQAYRESKAEGIPISLKVTKPLSAPSATEPSATEPSATEKTSATEKPSAAADQLTEVERRAPQPRFQREEEEKSSAAAVPSLSDDFHLREAIFIATDYLQLLKKQDPGAYYQAIDRGGVSDLGSSLEKVQDISGCLALKGLWQVGC